MTGKKKLYTLSLVTLLTLTFVSQSFAAESSFGDLEGTALKMKIETLQAKGYVKGTGDHQFAPDATLTTAQGIQLIVNALNLSLAHITFMKAPEADDYFVNADNQAWYAEALTIAANNGMDLPRDLVPDQVWTREAFIHHLMLAMEKHSNLPLIKIVPVSFKDEEQLTAAYQGSIQRALVLKIATLDANGNFNPESKISRAEAAGLIYNALRYMESHSQPTY